MTVGDVAILSAIVICAVLSELRWRRQRAAVDARVEDWKSVLAKRYDSEIETYDNMTVWLSECVEAGQRFAETLTATHKSERQELYTRIQRWEAPPAVAPEPEKDRDPRRASEAEDDEREEVPANLTELEMEKITANSEGGFIDRETGELFETLGDLREVRAWKDQRGFSRQTPVAEITASTSTQ